MDEFMDEFFEQEMFQAVERNHQRAVLAAQAAKEARQEREEPKSKKLPAVVGYLLAGGLGLIWAICMVFAGL